MNQINLYICGIKSLKDNRLAKEKKKEKRKENGIQTKNNLYEGQSYAKKMLSILKAEVNGYGTSG